MPDPIEPAVEIGSRGRDLPAYLSNGMIGLRVRENPLESGMALLAGFVGEHAERGIEALATVPYPLGCDLAIDDVWMSDAPQAISLISQAHAFSCGELTTRAAFTVGDVRLEIEVVTFCSRKLPTLVCQEIVLRADKPCRVRWRAFLDARGVPGELANRRTATPGEDKPVCDGVLRWRSRGGLSCCGLAYATEAEPHETRAISRARTGLLTEYGLKLHPDRPIRLRHMASLVTSALHSEPDFEAVRLMAQALDRGFETIRRENCDVWRALWRGRIRLIGADPYWQSLADAGFYYLNASVHSASPSSTSIFGLATWHDYHYYFGHVMWDIEAFAVGPLSVLQPDAARSLLDFRSRGLLAARNNAKLYGRLGLQFPWETAALTGEEATPGGASGAWREDHVNLHVAQAFANYADVTGNTQFFVDQAWPVLAGVSDWIVDRVTPRGGGYVFERQGGPAEQAFPVDNDAVTVLAARRHLLRSIEAAKAVGQAPPAAWRRVAEGLAPPMYGKNIIAMHEGYDPSEEKGATPSPLMALFPNWADVGHEVEQATLRFYLGLWDRYVGSPMLPALYGTWAAWAGDRALSLKLLEEGYGKYTVGRFLQTLEYRLEKAPGDAVAAGPFFANIGGFLSGLLFGFPGLRIGSGPPDSWAIRPVVLPQGWEAIEVDRLWIRGEPMRLVARQGAERAELMPATDG